MSCDFAVWYPSKRLTDDEADQVYAALCDEDTSPVEAHPAVDAFYQELTATHPEIDTFDEEDIDDSDLCPWSNSMDRSSGHVLMSCVWSQAPAVAETIYKLAAKHGLVVYDPQAARATYPGEEPPGP
jgi:hypothetical protein